MIATAAMQRQVATAAMQRQVATAAIDILNLAEESYAEAELAFDRTSVRDTEERKADVLARLEFAEFNLANAERAVSEALPL